jgi:hypothetical protein
VTAEAALNDPNCTSATLISSVPESTSVRKAAWIGAAGFGVSLFAQLDELVLAFRNPALQNASTDRFAAPRCLDVIVASPSC